LEWVILTFLSSNHGWGFSLQVNLAGGKEKPVQGKFKHEEFKAQYDRLAERNAGENKE
jgi:hypothetical protein